MKRRSSPRSTNSYRSCSRHERGDTRERCRLREGRSTSPRSIRGTVCVRVAGIHDFLVDDTEGRMGLAGTGPTVTAEGLPNRSRKKLMAIICLLT